MAKPQWRRITSILIALMAIFGTVACGKVWSTYTQNYTGNNMLYYSQQFENSPWVSINATINSSPQIGPLGGSTAEQLIEDTSTSRHIVGQTLSKSNSATTYVLSVYLQGSSRTYAVIGLSDSIGGDVSVRFNLSSGTIANGPTLVGSWANSSAGVIAGTGGWNRYWVSATSSTDTSLYAGITLSQSGGPLYAGDGTSGFVLWGAQLETGATPSAYSFRLGY